MAASSYVLSQSTCMAASSDDALNSANSPFPARARNRRDKKIDARRTKRSEKYPYQQEFEDREADSATSLCPLPAVPTFPLILELDGLIAASATPNARDEAMKPLSAKDNNREQEAAALHNKMYFEDFGHMLQSRAFTRELAKLLRGVDHTPSGRRPCTRCAIAREVWNEEQGPSEHICLCFALYCSSCSKPAMACSCATPILTASDDSDDYVFHTVNELTPDLRFCQVCGTCKGHEEFEPCDGRDCNLPAPQLCHTACMRLESHPQYEEGARLCSLCVANGREPYVESTDEEASECYSDTSRNSR